MRLLVVTAVEAERDAILRALDPAGGNDIGDADASVASSGINRVIDVVVGGVGAAEAAVGTTYALQAQPVDLVLSAGIGGGFAPSGPGALVVASGIVWADLGAQAPNDFIPLAELGFGRHRYDVDPDLSQRLAAASDAAVGEILTVATVTGTAERAAELFRRHPRARAEAMEGAGVAAAAARAGVEVAEIRAISNVVGPRDRSAWQIPQALERLARGVAAIAAVGWTAP
ncbi:MAG: futalosine hydrolase [Actinobacteria bacterium]|nr:futalosine hydrolase [Actinomycetota bacterium]